MAEQDIIQGNVSFNPGLEIENKNFAAAIHNLVQPIDFIEGLLQMPSDLTSLFLVKEAIGNQFYFNAYKKATRPDAINQGAVEWDMKTLSNIGLDSLEIGQRSLTIDRELVAGYQVATTKLQSKGGQAVNVLQANMMAVTNDIRNAIYRRVKAGLQNAMILEEVEDNTIETLVNWMQDMYDLALDAQLFDENNKVGWAWYVNRKKFNEIFGLNATFTAANNVPGGINNTMLQGMVWGLTPKDGISFNDIPFRIMNNENFKIDAVDEDGLPIPRNEREQYEMFFLNPTRLGTIVYVNDSSQGGIWTEPINTGMKDRMTAIKAAATVEFIPNVYVWDKDQDGISNSDKSPFGYAAKVKKENP